MKGEIDMKMKNTKVSLLLIVMIMLIASTIAFAEIQPRGIPCDECSTGSLVEKTETWTDCRTVQEGHSSSCNISGSHGQYWYNDVTLLKCTNCNFEEVLSYGKDYGWYCK